MFVLSVSLFLIGHCCSYQYFWTTHLAWSARSFKGGYALLWTSIDEAKCIRRWIPQKTYEDTRFGQQSDHILALPLARCMIHLHRIPQWQQDSHLFECFHAYLGKPTGRENPYLIIIRNIEVMGFSSLDFQRIVLGIAVNPFRSALILIGETIVDRVSSAARDPWGIVVAGRKNRVTEGGVFPVSISRSNSSCTRLLKCSSVRVLGI